MHGGGEEEAGKIFCGADQEKKIFCGADQEKPIEERRKPLPMELEREAVSVRNDLSHRMVNRMGDMEERRGRMRGKKWYKK